MQKSTAVLVMLCKRPEPGVGKQRLAAVLGMRQGYRIACQLLKVARDLLQAWPGPAIVSPARSEDCHWARRYFGHSLQIWPQTEGNLGQRINRLDQQLRGAGHQHLLYTGSDAPELTPELVQQAGRGLLEYDVVLISSSDGGVSLMGSRRPWPELTSMGWSTEQLMTDLIDTCQLAGLSVKVVGQCDDLDLLSDVRELLERWRGATLTPEQCGLQRELHQILETYDGVDS